jgi:hypothetical protein
MRANHDPME